MGFVDPTGEASENQINGANLESETVKNLRAQGFDPVEKMKISVLDGNGKTVNAVADYAYMKDGKLVLGEVKFGDEAKLSPEQKIAYKGAIEKGRVQIVSDKKARALGLRAGKPVAVAGVSFATKGATRVLRQAAKIAGIDKKLVGGSFSILGRGAKLGLAAAGSTALMSVEAAMHSAPLGENSDCPGCLVNGHNYGLSQRE